MDRERADNKVRGPLHGIPVLIKDNYNTADMPTSGGALGLATLQPAADAFQVKKLRDAGAVILGKTTMHELASGITNISSLTGTNAQSVRSVSRAGRLERRHRRGDRRELRGRGHGQRHVRIDPHSGGEPESRRPARHARPVEPRRRDAAVVDAGHRRTAGAKRHRSRDHARRDGRARIPPIRSRPKAPRTFRSRIATRSTADGLKGARIGVLRALWGTAPEDDEVAGIVRKALDGFKAQGAEVVDISVPGLDDLLRDSSVINDEFKFDLAAYLAKMPNAPVKSLGEILDRGLHHAELDAQFRLRNQPEKRETEHYRQAMIKRRTLRAAVLATLEELRIDALAYPTLRRKPALIGEAQAGTNCQLSATTGLPAIAMPAGFSTDGLPIALELLGGAWEEAKLLKYAYAWEQATKPRKAPFSTPPLVNGAAPAPTLADITIGAGLGQVHLRRDDRRAALRRRRR